MPIFLDYFYKIPRLEDDIQLNDHAKPIHLPGPDNPGSPVSANVTGWGGIYPHDPAIHQYQQQRLSCQLMETNLFIVSPAEEMCREITYGDLSHKICAAREGADSCQGDSGRGITNTESMIKPYLVLKVVKTQAQLHLQLELSLALLSFDPSLTHPHLHKYHVSHKKVSS